MAQPLRYLGIILFIFIIGMSSCMHSQQISYFSNASDTTLLTRTEDAEALIQKNDILSIYISSLNAEASAVFNAPNSMATSTTTSSGTTSGAGGYLVNQEGNIQLPILGTIKASGITKRQLKEDITNQILDKKLLLDPIVTIRHLNYEVTVIGEVGKPSVINVPNEKISLLKALGIAGDITVYGKKDNVLLIREIEGKRKVKRINLNSKNFLTSSYYYLQPNDIIYVEPNKQKAVSANSNQQLIISLVSGVATIVAVVVSQLLVK